jgi:hypothetical protein
MYNLMPRNKRDTAAMIQTRGSTSGIKLSGAAILADTLYHHMEFLSWITGKLMKSICWSY